MKRNLKIFSGVFLSGVGAARVLIWLNTGTAHLLVMWGGWEVADAVKAAPWVLFALIFSLLLSVSEMLSTDECNKRSAEKRSSLNVSEGRNNARRDV